MLAHQAEREDKTPTPEVSNYGLTTDNNLDLEGSSNVAGISSLRRRNVPAKLNACNASAFNDNTLDSVSAFFDLSNDNPEVKVQNPRKRYPKLTANYPKIPENNRVHSKDIKKSQCTDPIFLKPPSAQPPVFLKCKIKKRYPSEDDSEETVSCTSDENSPSQTTDLDIQFSKLKLESLIRSDLSSETKKSSAGSHGEEQTLKQYCNFEEKKVMRVAPHIRRKDVICDTVDAWSNDTGRNISESPKYKPLVFGGTYPIDLPLQNSNRLTEKTFAKKNMSLTYDIDIPTSCS